MVMDGLSYDLYSTNFDPIHLIQVNFERIKLVWKLEQSILPNDKRTPKINIKRKKERDQILTLKRFGMKRRSYKKQAQMRTVGLKRSTVRDNQGIRIFPSFPKIPSFIFSTPKSPFLLTPLLHYPTSHIHSKP